MAGSKSTLFHTERGRLRLVMKGSEVIQKSYCDASDDKRAAQHGFYPQPYIN